jgi:anthranilate phosphoribosyltransferase
VTDADAPSTDLAPVISQLVRGEDLGDEQAAAALGAILSGEVSDVQIAGFAVALRAKGESVDEIATLARTMREFGEKIEVDGPLVDTCGTGGDRKGTLNVSTAAALVVAGAGARVCKHGNRAASSKCGSADVLEELGVAVDLGPAGVARCIEEVGIGFCFAPRFHPAMRHAAGARRALGVATTFNFLGPLSNPAGARHHALGISDPGMAERVVHALDRLGTERALVFYGHDGLDELTTTTTSTVYELDHGHVTHYDISPVDLGIPAVDPDALAGGDAAYNAEVTRRVLAGDQGPARDIVVLNAAAGLLAAGVAANFTNAIEEAAAAIDDGLVAERLEALVRVSTAAAAEE